MTPRGESDLSRKKTSKLEGEIERNSVKDLCEGENNISNLEFHTSKFGVKVTRIKSEKKKKKMQTANCMLNSPIST